MAPEVILLLGCPPPSPTLCPGSGLSLAELSLQPGPALLCSVPAKKLWVWHCWDVYALYPKKKKGEFELFRERTEHLLSCCGPEWWAEAWHRVEGCPASFSL